jgi:MFS family permease
LFAQLVVVRRSPLSARQLTNWGLAAAFLSFAIFLLTGHFGPLVFALALSGLGFGMARPGFVTGASLAVEPHEQGAVAGIIGGASATGFIFGPLIGWMYERSPYVPYWFGAIMIVLLFISMFVSPTLRHAGAMPPEPEAAEEAAEAPLANG